MATFLTKDMPEHYAPRAFFVSIGGFSEIAFDQFVKKHSIMITPKGWPVYEVMRKLCDHVYHRELTSVEHELKREQMIERRIKNQERLGNLVPIDRAKQRMRTTLVAVANMVRHAIKQSAPRVALVSDARDAENVMVEAYNNAIQFLGETAKNVEWEFEGRNSKLGRTELFDASEENTGERSS